ncbi:hypothetical protein [Actinocorallia populi]|uniref:hypothetical protein n=1 Tax=Actinocorallia populi TaxID=2079200 RepID=UPI0013005B1A|nr:hypothetical protein [Actinocorallia populi]
MSRIAKFAVIAAASAAAVAVSAVPASAWTGGSVTAGLAPGTSLVVSIGGSPVANCNTADLTGSITAGGALNVSSANIADCDNGVVATAQNLPWGGNLTDPSGASSLTGFRVSAKWMGLTCVYGGNIAGTNDTSPTATFTNQTVNKVSGFLCPGSAQVSAQFAFSGPGV